MRAPALLPASTTAMPPGQRLARGVMRHLRDRGFACLAEFVPAPGLRVDVIGLGVDGRIWIVECKSSRADFALDRKWPGYLVWCDLFSFAVDDAFPVEILPADAGLIRADAYGAEIEREAPATPLAGARRRAVALRFGRTAAGRLAHILDPPAG